MPSSSLSPQAQRRLLARLLQAMAALALLAFVALGWQAAGGPPAAPHEASLRTARLQAGQWRWAEAPALPRGLRLADGASLHVLLLRLPDGALRAFYATASADGRPTLPAGSPGLGTPGQPCADFAPDMRQGDIACRQAAPGFEFALRHRWSLHGEPLTSGTPALPVAAGHEDQGDWRPDLAWPPAAAAR